MALRDIRTGEMVDVTRDWRGRTNTLANYPLTAPFISVIADTQNELIESTKYAAPPVSAAERDKIREILKQADGEWDASVRILVAALALLEEAFPEQAAEYQHTSSSLFPDGAAVVNTSYRNEAGETERMVNRRESDARIRTVLASSKLNDVPLGTWFDTLLDAGRRIGPLAAKLEISPSRQEDIVREFKARQRWTSMVTTLRRNCELAGWSAEDMATFFDQVDRLSSERQAPKSGGDGAPSAGGDATDHG